MAIPIENALDTKPPSRTETRDQTKTFLEEEISAEAAKLSTRAGIENRVKHGPMMAPTDRAYSSSGDGTGKELIARATHDLHRRSQKWLVELDFAAIPLGLLESALFGHEKVHLPVPSRQKRSATNSQAKARGFSMKFAIYLSNFRRKCCAFCRSRNLRGSAATAP